MYSPWKFATRIGSIGKPLPDPFPSFAFYPVTFRRGATSMIAGAPGSFKSVMALNMLAKWGLEGKRVLYFSADSDEFVVSMRLGAILTGTTINKVEQDILHKRTDVYEKAMRRLTAVHFEYTQGYLDDITNRADAFEAIYGDWPEVLFIDNFLNFVDSGDWPAMLEFTRQLDAFAREIKAHICILHHASEAAALDRPAPRDKIQGKVTQIPRLVLTVAARDRALYWSCVKNTNGPQDPTAEKMSEFLVQPNMAIKDTGFGVETR